MFYFVQFRPDKKESWTMVDEHASLDKPPAFKTVLSISGDPAVCADQGVDPDTFIKYYGPMYFDLDGDGEIDQVLDAARGIVGALIKEHYVQPDAIQVFLSGKKGVHILVHPLVFGVKTSKVLLPLVWKRFALKFDSRFVDRSVYSMGKGRIWRCCNIKRPDGGTYKVQITLSELEKLTASAYAEAVKSTRPEIPWPEQIKEVPSLVSFVDAATTAARKELKDKKKAVDGVTVEDLRAVPGVPGCIELLVTQGDCEESNWNQAAMQLAGYIAGRYKRDEEAEEYGVLVNRFLDNVASKSRPDRKTRAREMKGQLDRAFSGATKFSAGGVIAVLGKSCGKCVICAKESVLAAANTAANEKYTYDEATNIRITPDGVYVVGKDSARQILNCAITQSLIFIERDKTQKQERVLSGAYELRGGEVKVPYNVELEETLFTDKRRLGQELAGSGAVFEGNESDLQRLYRTVLRNRKGIEAMIRTACSGIILHETDEGIYPNLVTRDESYRKGLIQSEYIYSGPVNFAPKFSSVPDFETQDEVEEMISALRAVFEMNEPNIMIPAIGWTMATHLKAHLTLRDKSFPMLNLCGTSQTGKSSTAFLLLAMNSFPYRKSPSWNAEVDTLYPLEELVTTSTTFIRLVEEANELNAKRNWPRLCGILKASWDEGGILKGAIKGRGAVSEAKPNPAPIMYLSEQSFPVQSVRTRSIECMFTTKSIEDPVYASNHAVAVSSAKKLEMLAKVLVNTALNLSMSQVLEWRRRASDLLPSSFMGRIRTSYEVVLVGLMFLSHVAGFYSKDMGQYVEDRIDEYARILERDKDDTLSEKRISALAEVLMCIDQMAMEVENQAHGLKAGVHYWKTDTAVYLDARSVFPRILRYMRGMGRDAQIGSYVQMMRLLRGETYYKGEIRHPDNPATQIVQLDIQDMMLRGIEFPHLQEQVLA